MSEADDETIPDSFFDIASGSEKSGEESDDGEADSSSDDGNASEVEHDMLESIFGDVPAAATGARDDGKDSVVVDASDKSEDERKMAATSATGKKKERMLLLFTPPISRPRHYHWHQMYVRRDGRHGCVWRKRSRSGRKSKG